jgi:hypothetical protein
MNDLEPGSGDVLRERAISALKKRRDFRGHLLVYLLVNSALVTVWAMTGHRAFFWPVFVIVFWGIGLAMNAWDVYSPSDFSEDSIQRQIRRIEERR